MCVCIVYVNECRCSGSPEEDMKYLEPGDTGSCIPLDVGTGN